MPSSYVDRTFIAFMKCRGLDAFALKALREANHLLGLAIGARLSEMRETGEPFLTAASKRAVAEVAYFVDDEDVRMRLHGDGLTKAPTVGVGQVINELRSGGEEDVETVLDGPIGDCDGRVGLPAPGLAMEDEASPLRDEVGAEVRTQKGEP